MKFLLNMNLPRLLGEGLQGAGHEFRHAGDVGLSRADDAAIVAAARNAGEVILTHDLDYGHLLAFSGESRPSVVIFRTRNGQPTYLFQRFQSVWNEIGPALQRGAIVIVEDGSVRVRDLPIR